MNNSQVAHLWANQSRESAKSSSFFFNGGTIYSYGTHFPIARHYKGVVLFTSKSYSVSTARHMSEVRRAITHLQSFTVSDVLRDPCGADVREYAEQIKTLSMTAARKRDPEWALKQLQSAIDEANLFCQTFGFKTRFTAPENFEALKVKAKEESSKKAKATLAKNKRIERENAILIQRWLSGESVSLPYNLNKVYLRVNRIRHDDHYEEMMQTSKNATVPLHEAEKAFRFVMLKRESGWKRNGETFKVGDFQLDAVNEFGVIAGCHRIEWAEIERFAKPQGWIK